MKLKIIKTIGSYQRMQLNKERNVMNNDNNFNRNISGAQNFTKLYFVDTPIMFVIILVIIMKRLETI